jgi:ABC-type lipoprotein export system ATPase subunit
VTSAAINVHDLFCLYRGAEGDVAALRGLDLRVAAGERVVVHGPSGSGKTTLLRVLEGSTAPSAGHASVAGHDVRTLARRRDVRARVLGLVDQHHARVLRPELDCLANVSLQLAITGVGRRARRARAEALLDAAGIAHLAGAPPVAISGGEAQRVALCAALAHAPRVVLADEPTGELDQATALQVYDLLGALARDAGATLLVVSHDEGAARIADRVVRIRDGRLSEVWEPGAPERVVVDRRGWLRLPAPARSAAGITGSAKVAVVGRRIVLAPSEVAPEAAAPPQPPGAVGRDRALGAVARLEGIHVSYGERAVLDGLDLTVSRGLLTVLRGRSGSGKTTVVRLLAGLARPDRGSVEVDGVVLEPLGRAARATFRRTSLGIAGQTAGLAESLDAGENLALALTIRGLRDPAGAAALVAALGLEPLAGRPVRLLSGGERQRVAVGRALVARPTLVILDEPTSQLDEGNAERLASLLRAEVAAGATILCTTHDRALAAAADVVIEL